MAPKSFTKFRKPNLQLTPARNPAGQMMTLKVPLLTLNSQPSGNLPNPLPVSPVASFLKPKKNVTHKIAKIAQVRYEKFNPHVGGI